jgi:putative transposase
VISRKSGGLVREGTAVKYAAIADWAPEKEYSVAFMCDQLGVARQGYYRWRSVGPCERERTDAELTEQILAIHTELDGHPGVRRVWAELTARGARVSPKRIGRLMRGAGLRGRHPRAWKKTTIAGQRPLDAPDLIGQDFTAPAPETRWCGEITYVRTVEGWVYTATVIELHSRTVVGYALADHLRTSLIIEALTAALLTRKPPKGVIFHPDSANTPRTNSPASAPSMAYAAPWDDAPPATTTPSPNHSSPPTKRNSSTPDPGTTSPTSGNTHSSGSKATTAAGDTPPSTT